MYTVKMTKVRVLAVVGSLLFGAGTFGFFYGFYVNLFERNLVKDSVIILVSSLPIVCFFLMSLWLFLYCKSLIITEETLTSETFFRSYSIDLNSITFIENGAGSGNMIIGNDNQRIAFPSFEYWSGKEKNQFIDQLNLVLSKKGLSLKNSFRAMLPFSKGFR